MLAWLGQAGLPAETSEDAGLPEHAAPPQTAQWMTLLPSVPVSQSLFVNVATDGELAGVVDDSELVDNGEPVNIADDGEPVDEKRTATAGPDASPFGIMAATVPLPVAIAATLVPDFSAHAVPANDAPPRRAANELAPPAQSAAVTPLTPPDKGEVIWRVDLVVKEPALGAAPGLNREKAVPSPQVAPPSGEPSLDTQAQAGGDHDPDARPDAKPPEKPAVEPASQFNGDRRQRDFADVAPIPEEHAPAAEKQAPPARDITALRHIEPSSSAKPVDPVAAPAINGADLDAAKKLRPAQIATINVDVPASPGGAESPMRLAVTQRGDQVKVQLRSWNASAPPIDNGRMEPLLRSLTGKGFSPDNLLAARLDDHAPLYTEQVREKMMPVAEAGGGSNDQQSFQNSGDRQQKNQERQQHAFLMRRQVRNTQTGEFDPQSVFNANQSE